MTHVLKMKSVQVLERDSCIAQLQGELACSRQAHAEETARMNAQASLADERAEQLEQLQKQRAQEKVTYHAVLLITLCCSVHMSPCWPVSRWKHW